MVPTRSDSIVLIGPGSSLTDESVVEMYDQIKNQVAANIAAGKAPMAAPVKEMQTDRGVNFNADGVLACTRLRGFVKPCKQYLRDWQHTLVASGVAGSLLAGVCHAIKKCNVLVKAGITLETCTEYCSHWVLPTAYAKINTNWFDNHFLEQDHVKHFASDVLSMVPLLLAFMIDFCRPLGQLEEHIEALSLMEQILSLLICTTAMDEACHAELTSIIDRFRALFYEFFHQLIKIKFHHLGHLADDLLKIGKALNCFVLERKHRDYKSIVLHVFVRSNIRRRWIS